jgi:hypothetical protein
VRAPVDQAAADHQLDAEQPVAQHPDRDRHRDQHPERGEHRLGTGEERHHHTRDDHGQQPGQLLALRRPGPDQPHHRTHQMTSVPTTSKGAPAMKHTAETVGLVIGGRPGATSS